MNRKSIIPDILISLFALVQVFVHLYDVSGNTMNGIRVVPGLLCLVYYLRNGNKVVKSKGIISAVVLSFAMLISMMYNGNTRPANLLWIWSYFGIAMVLYEFGMRIAWARLLFYVCSLFFLFMAFRGDVNVQEVMYGTSENGISTGCILVLFIYYSSIVKNGGNSMPFLPILIILVISLWTATRSSMLVMGLMLVFAIYYNNLRKDRKRSVIAQVAVFVFLVVAVIYFFENYYSVLSSGLERKLEREGLESTGREHLWQEYLGSLFDNPLHFILGTSSSNMNYPLFFFFHGNAHNAFIILHSKFGLLGFLYVVIILIKALRKTIRQKETILLALLLMAIIRSMFDWTAFPGYFDTIFYFYLLYGLDKNGFLKSQKQIKTSYIF